MTSDSEEYINSTPPDLREAAGKAKEGLLPEKSKTRYEKAYNIYKKWCAEKGAKNIGSETVLLAYFSELARNKKSSTLWSIYSMLRTTLALRERIDISKNSILLAFLKRQNIGYKAKKSSTFTKENVDEFLRMAPMEYLPFKVALVIGISGACRSDELFKMKTTDIHFLGNKISIEIPETKTYKSRAFMIADLNWVAVVKQYSDLRSNIQNHRFFMQSRYGKFTNQPFGHNSISQFPKKIASFLKLDHADTFTGHCFRRTAATLLANNGGDLLQLKRLGGWKSSTVAEGYIDSSSENQTKTAKLLSSNNVSAASLQNVSISCRTSAGQSTTQEINASTSTSGAQSGLTISVNAYNQSNVTINFNK